MSNRSREDIESDALMLGNKKAASLGPITRTDHMLLLLLELALDIRDEMKDANSHLQRIDGEIVRIGDEMVPSR